MSNLDFTNVIYSFIFIVGISGIAVLISVEIGKNIFISAIRCIIQLFILGSVLIWAFTKDSPGILFSVLLFMILISSFTIKKRIKQKNLNIFKNSFISLFLTSILTGVFILQWAFPQNPWYKLSTTIPLLGMLLGSSLTGISLSLDRFIEGIQHNHERIESLLAIGATKYEACKHEIKSALRSGLTPILNSMMVVGLVGIPGVMVGQMISGTSPISAALDQMVILMLIACSTFLSSLISIFLTFQGHFNSCHQFKPLTIEG